MKSVMEAKEYIESINKMHSNSTHNVPLYRVYENNQEYFKYTDDGEPSGTAGKPMADIIERKQIYNIAVVATRYFGGIKLGAGGLIRNYAKVSKLLIENSNIVEYIQKNIYILIVNYDSINIVDKILIDNNIEIIEKSFSDKVNIKIYIENEKINIFNDINGIELIGL